MVKRLEASFAGCIQHEIFTGDDGIFCIFQRMDLQLILFYPFKYLRILLWTCETLRVGLENIRLRLSFRNGSEMDQVIQLIELLQFLQDEVRCHNWSSSNDFWYIFHYIAIFLKALNSLHFKNYLDFFCEWLPQQIFFFCTFGYMCILIIYKWTVPWGEERPTADAPSLIGQMIALPLKLGSTEGKPLWDMDSQ